MSNLFVRQKYAFSIFLPNLSWFIMFFLIVIEFSYNIAWWSVIGGDRNQKWISDINNGYIMVGQSGIPAAIDVYQKQMNFNVFGSQWSAKKRLFIVTLHQQKEERNEELFEGYNRESGESIETINIGF